MGTARSRALPGVGGRQAGPLGSQHFANTSIAVSGNTAPVFNMTLVEVPEDLPQGECVGSAPRLLPIAGCMQGPGADPAPAPAPTGAVAFVLTAYDADGDPLQFGLEGADAFYFSVNSNTGSVTLVASLDREVGARARARARAGSGAPWAG